MAVESLGKKKMEERSRRQDRGWGLGMLGMRRGGGTKQNGVIKKRKS